MKKHCADAGRVLFFALILMAGTLGYVYYERTLVDWWLPIAMSALVALASIPLLGQRWHWLVGSDRTYNLICNFLTVGALFYFFTMAGNYFLADASTSHEEETVIERKEIVNRRQVHRRGRRSYTTSRTTTYYYLHVRFPDGTRKKVTVSSSAYNRSRTGGHRTFHLQTGLFGFRVIK